MKKLLLCLLNIALFVTADAQQVWENNFEVAGNYTYAPRIKQTSDSGFVISAWGAGWAQGNPAPCSMDFNMILLKVNKLGTRQWSQVVGGNLRDEGLGVEVIGNSYYVGGFTTYTVTGNQQHTNAYLVKFDLLGNKLWDKTYGSDTSQYTAEAMCKSTNNTFLLAGDYYNAAHAKWYGWVTKVDSAGSILWSYGYEEAGQNFMAEVFQTIAPTTDGGCIVGGFDPNAARNMYVLKLDANGDTLWAKEVGILPFGGEATLNSVIQTADGGYMLAGGTLADALTSIGGNNSDPFIVKLDAAGNFTWGATYEGVGSTYYDEEAKSVVQSADGGYVICGTEYISGYEDNIFYMKIDSLGNVLWAKQNPGTQALFAGYRDYGSDIITTMDGGYVATGDYATNILPWVACSTSGYIIKMTADGISCHDVNLTVNVKPVSVDVGDLHYNKDNVPSRVITNTGCLFAAGSSNEYSCNTEVYTADFSFAGTGICSNDSVLFTDASQLNPTTWAWNFGDAASGADNTSTLQNPKHLFSSAGTFTISLTSSNGTLPPDNAVKSITVKAGPTVTITPNTVICLGDPPLSIGAAGAVSYTWYPSTGLSSTTGNLISTTPPSVGVISYTVTGTNANGCKGTATMDITVNPGPTLSIVSNASICYGSSTVLNASSGNVTNYTWSPASGLSSTTGASVGASPSVSTTYTVTGTNTCGTAKGKILVTVKPLPNFTAIPSPGFLCPGQTGTIAVAGTATSYIWSPSESLSASVGTFVTDSPTITTIYTITGINSCGSYTVNVLISVGTTPTVYPGPNATICSGAIANLNVSGASTYIWIPSDGLTFTVGSITQASPDSTTIYTITGSIDCGSGVIISGTGNITVKVLATPTVLLSENVSICSGFSATLSASGADSYSWSPSTGLDIVTGPVVTSTVQSNITYNVTGTSIDGCSSSNSITVKINNNPNVDAGPDVTIVLGETATLKGSGGPAYVWSPSETLSCTNCQEPAATPPIATKYYLTVTDSNGCTSIDSVIVNIICDNAFVPDAFSPNGDNQNEVLYVYGTCIKTLTSFDIYNRWGEIVFTTTNINEGWNGKMNGNGVELPPAVYCYFLKAISTNGDREITRNGNVSLIR